MSNNLWGYTLSFWLAGQTQQDYLFEGASCAFAALRKVSFTGRAECYSDFEAVEHAFRVGILLRHSPRSAKLDWHWWKALLDLISDFASRSRSRFTLSKWVSEPAQKEMMTQWLVPRGMADFETGRVVRAIGKDSKASFFSRWAAQSPNC